MAYTTLKVSIENHIAHVQLNRPGELNTMNAAFWREIPAVFGELDANRDVRVIVLSSTGKHFTAGLDLKAAAALIGGENAEKGRYGETFRHLVKELQQSFTAIEECRKPVLAAVHGGCIGGGVDMVTACDCRYMTADAYFCIKEIDLSIVADVGTLQRLPKVIPAGLARELAYTGRKIHAEESQSCGLVNAVYPDQDAMIAAVMQIAATIAGHSPLAITGTKEMLNYTRDHSVAESLNYVATWQAAMFSPDDVQKAVMASMTKQQAEFEGLLGRVGFEED